MIVNEWPAAADILKQAASLVEKRGWHQGVIHPTGGGTHCLAMAIETAFRRSEHSIAAFEHARYAMHRQLKLPIPPILNDTDSVPYWGKSLMSWNDDHGRTVSEVKSQILHAASYAEQKAKVHDAR